MKRCRLQRLQRLQLLILPLLMLLLTSSADAWGHKKAAKVKLSAAASGHSVTLAWTASVTTGANYNMYRSSAAGGPFTIISPVTTTTYVDATVAAGLTYYYYVTATCGPTACGTGITPNSESSPSNTITATIPSPQPPSPPTGLSGTVAVNHIGTQDSITATWTDGIGVPTFYVLFNKSRGFIQMNGAPAINSTGTYSITYTGSPFNGNFAICDYNNCCMILPFVG